MNKAIFLLFVSQLLLFTANGQTYEIPDPGLKSCLLNKYPTLLDAEERLIIANAESKTGDVHCTEYSIKNIDGIQHFKSITVLNLGTNLITDISAISGLTQLKEIYFYNNSISITPDFTDFLQLKRLNLDNNNLTVFPEVNQGIEQLNLISNNIQSFLPLANLPNLTVFYGSSNGADTIPDISHLKRLKTLHLGNNHIQYIRGYENLDTLNNLYLESNNLKHNLSLENLTQLKILYISDNEQTEITDLSGHDSLNTAFIGNNKLTFKDIEPLTFHPGFSDIFQYYWLQDSVGQTLSISRIENQSFEYNPEIDREVNGLRYTWYKNEDSLTSNTTGTLQIEKVKESDAGLYYCKIKSTNPLLDKLTLITKPLYLEVTPCYNFSNVSYDVISESCHNTGSITVNNLPYFAKMELVKNGTTDTMTSSSESFKNLRAGSYNLKIYSNSACHIEFKDLKVYDNRKNCGEFSFTPNGDGMEDEFFIPESGRARVYNKNGQLIREINVPGSWDGRNDNGSSVSFGFYIIIVNGEKTYKVTVLK